jgi:hypothetical protein
MANTFLTNDIILKTALMEFENNLVFAKTVRRDYQNKFSNETGASIRIRKPTRYTVREGDQIDIQDINQQFTNLTIDHKDGVDVAITSNDLALRLDDFNREILSPAMVALANKVDSRLYDTTSSIYNFVGTAGTAPNSFGVIDDANSLLNSVGIPDDERYLLLKSFDAGAVRKALYNTFNQKFNSEIILKGAMGNLSGFDVFSVQNAIRPAYSSITTSIGTPAINGANQSGTSLTIDGLTISTTGILKTGATFTIAGVNSVNPVSRTDTGQLAKFTLTADADSNGSGQATLQINPPITLTGPYQTVTALPSDNALLTVNATHTINVAYHREAFTLAVINLPVGANGAYQKTMVDERAKVSLRMSRQYEISNDKDIIRFDILYGVKCFPEYATRVMGS